MLNIFRKQTFYSYSLVCLFVSWILQWLNIWIIFKWFEEVLICWSFEIVAESVIKILWNLCELQLLLLLLYSTLHSFKYLTIN